MRAAFSDTLVTLARNDPKVLLLSGDHGYALFDQFRKVCPSQYINAGIAEQNMVGMAAGLARSGFRPFVYGLSAFIPIRVLEQIKLDVAHDQLPVVFLGDGAGFVYSHLGTSHQSTEDIACARSIPHLSVYSPADRFEMKRCLELAYDSCSTIYLRMGKADRGDVHETPSVMRVGQLVPLRPDTGGKVAFICTGSMAKTGVLIAAKNYNHAGVWSAPFIKPIDAKQVTEICSQNDTVVVLEEHSVFGGLGSVVAEIASQYSPTRVLRVGVNDRFSSQCGSYEYLLKEHGLDQASIEQKIQQFISSGTSAC